MENSELLASLPKDLRRLAILSKSEGDFTYLQMEIVTYADLWERANVVVDFIERVWDTYEPFQTKLEVSVSPRNDIRTGAGRIFGLKRHWKKWQEIRRLLLAGELESIEMYEWAATHSYSLRHGTNVRLEVHFGQWTGQAQGHQQTERPLYDPREAKVLLFCIDTRVWEGQVSAEVQEQTVQLACDLFQAVDGACGFVDLGKDYLTYRQVTPYEWHLGMERYGPNRGRLCNEVRGAFWGSLLSARHVQALGGSELVMQQAPCHKVTRLVEQCFKRTDDQSLYLQVTPALEEISPEDYARLRAFLAPLLISTRGQYRITILEPALVASLGNAVRLRESVVTGVQRATILPNGALLIGYRIPEGWPSAHKALERIGCGSARGYRDIPQLRSRWRVDDTVIWTLPERIPPRSRSGPILPTIIVQPCIPAYALKFRVSFVNPLEKETAEKLKRLVQEWWTLEYDTKSEDAVISFCSIPERVEDALVWRADLEPVGQDAYFQLVMMLDEFSRSTARLGTVNVGAWAK